MHTSCLSCGRIGVMHKFQLFFCVVNLFSVRDIITCVCLLKTLWSSRPYQIRSPWFSLHKSYFNRYRHFCYIYARHLFFPDRTEWRYVILSPDGRIEFHTFRDSISERPSEAEAIESSAQNVGSGPATNEA